MATNHEFHPIMVDETLSHAPTSNMDKQLSIAERDNNDLIRLGKKPVLKRNFGFMSILGFSCTILITWEASLIVFETSFTNGGPNGLVYGFIFVWIGTAAIYTTLSELASMAPTAGGQYHWVSMLAPSRYRKFFSYITGWLTVIGWQGALASAIYVSATLIQGVAVLNNPTYVPERWHAVLLFWVIILFSIAINAFVSGLLSKFEGLILILHILGFVAIMIPLIYLAPHQPSSFVFNTFRNGGEWPTNGLSFMIGIIGSVFAFGGADGAIHMSEEIHNASVVVPRSILLSIFINGSLGLATIIATLYCIIDVEAIESTPTEYPFMEIFRQATESTSGTTIMISIIIVMQLSADVGLLASCSRMSWSFARDRGLPAWRTLSQVNSRTSIPVASIIFTCVINALLSLIIFGSSSAFNNIVSIGVIGLFSSYFLASSLLLYRRCTGGIKSIGDVGDGVVNTKGARMVWGPWRVPGTIGIVINAFACAYMMVIMFFCLWPPELPVTPQNMNYAVLMFSSVVTFSICWYHIRAKHEYDGPIVETEAGYI